MEAGLRKACVLSHYLPSGT